MDRPLRLVLLGGGHAMLPSLAQAQAWTDAGVDVTLIDPQRWLYYSGMVPEYLGGVYAEPDIRIDLVEMAQRAGASVVSSAATALDPERRVVATADGTECPFDVLAVDVGAVNPGVPDGAVATKPIYRTRELAPRLEDTLQDPTADLRLAIVGGGAAGAEIAMNVTGRFQGAGRTGDLDLTIIEQANRLLPGFPPGLQTHVQRRLRKRGVSIRLGATVQRVESTDRGPQVHTNRSYESPVSADAVLWATGTVGPPFLQESGLSTDDRGFLHVTSQLRMPSHPRIFAAGDCATIVDQPLDKVGVHAVKQGSALRANLDRTLRRLSEHETLPISPELISFRPYPVAPLILSTGTRDGLWTAGSFWAAHPWLLRLKHAIDRQWIRQYAPVRWGDAGWRDLLGAEAAATETHPRRVSA
jgi:selenide,water dikinase